jgi:hypothetical protein
MGEDFCRETGGEVIDFAEDPAGTKNNEWERAWEMC